MSSATLLPESTSYEEDEEKKSDDSSPCTARPTVVSPRKMADLRNYRMSLSRANSFRHVPVETLALEQQHFLSQSFSHFDTSGVPASRHGSVSPTNSRPASPSPSAQPARCLDGDQRNRNSQDGSKHNKPKTRRGTGAGGALSPSRRASSRSKSPSESRASAVASTNTNSSAGDKINQTSHEQTKAFREQMSGMDDSELRLLIRDLKEEPGKSRRPSQSPSRRPSLSLRKERSAPGELAPNHGGRRLSRAQSFRHAQKAPCPSVTPCPNRRQSLSKSLSLKEVNSPSTAAFPQEEQQRQSSHKESSKSTHHRRSSHKESSRSTHSSSRSSKSHAKKDRRPTGTPGELVPTHGSRRLSKAQSFRRASRAPCPSVAPCPDKRKSLRKSLSHNDFKTSTAAAIPPRAQLALDDKELRGCNSKLEKNPTRKPSIRNGGSRPGLSDNDLKVLIKDVVNEEAGTKDSKSQRQSHQHRKERRPTGSLAPNPGRRLSKVQSFRHATKAACPSVAPCPNRRESLIKSVSHDNLQPPPPSSNDSKREVVSSRGRSLAQSPVSPAARINTSISPPRRPTSVKPIPPLEEEESNDDTNGNKPPLTTSSQRRRRSSASPGRRRSSVSPTTRRATGAAGVVLTSSHHSTTKRHHSPTMRRQSVSPENKRRPTGAGRALSPGTRKRASVAVPPPGRRPTGAPGGRQSRMSVRSSVRQSDALRGRSHSPKRDSSFRVRPSLADVGKSESLPAPLIDMYMSDSDDDEEEVRDRKQQLLKKPQARPSWAPEPLIDDMEMSDSSEEWLDLRSSFLRRRSSFKSEGSGSKSSKDKGFRRSRSFRPPRKSEARILRKSFAHPAPATYDSEDENMDDKRGSRRQKGSSRHDRRDRRDTRHDSKSSRHDRRNTSRPRSSRNSEHHPHHHRTRDSRHRRSPESRCHEEDRSRDKDRESSPRGQHKTCSSPLYNEQVERFIASVGDDVNNESFWINMVLKWESMA